MAAYLFQMLRKMHEWPFRSSQRSPSLILLPLANTGVQEFAKKKQYKNQTSLVVICPSQNVCTELCKVPCTEEWRHLMWQFKSTLKVSLRDGLGTLHCLWEGVTLGPCSTETWKVLPPLRDVRELGLLSVLLLQSVCLLFFLPK